MLALQGREGQPRISLDRRSRESASRGFLSTATPREIRAWPLSPCRANVGSTGERGPALGFLSTLEREPAADFSRPPPREKSALGTLSAERNPRLATLPPVEPMLPKIFKVQNRKKKKVPTKLPSFESSRREPHFYRIARIRSERDLILAFFYRKICICKWFGYQKTRL